MKRFAFILVLLLAATFRLPAQNAPTPEENSLTNSLLHVRYGLQYCMPQNKPYDYDAYVDTLYTYLYRDSVQVKVSVEMLAKLTLQSYFIETKDPRTDYLDIWKTLLITYKFEPFHDAYFATCARALGNYFEEKNLWRQAVQVRDWALVALAKVLGQTDTPLAYQLCMQNAHLCFRQRDYGRSIGYARQMCRMSEHLAGRESPQYRDDLSLLASTSHVAGQYALADSCFAVIQQQMEQDGRQSTPEYTRLLLDRADVFHNLEDYARATATYTDAIGRLQETDPDYLQALFELASLYYEQGDNARMLPLLRRAIAAMERQEPETPQYVFHFLTLCNASNVGNERADLLRLARRLKRDGDVPSMATLAYAYQKNHAYDKFDALAAQIVALMDGYMAAGETDAFDEGLSYVQVLFTRSRYWQKEMEYLWYNVADMRQAFGDEHPLVFDLLEVITSEYLVVGDYRRAVQLADSCLALPNLTGRQRFGLLRNKADALSLIGRFDEAVRAYRELLPLAANRQERWNVWSHGIVGNLMAEIDVRQTNRDEWTGPDMGRKKQTLLDEATALLAGVRTDWGETGEEYVTALTYLASAYYLCGRFDEMLQTARTCETAVKTHIRNKTLKALYLETLVPFYIAVKDYKKAYALIDRQSLDDSSALFAERNNTLTLLAETSLGLGRYKDAQHYYTLQARGIIDETSRNFAFLTAAGRNSYWRMYRQYIYDAGKFIRDAGRPSDFAGTVYDLALFSKGLLLNSAHELERLIAESGDSILARQYQTLGDLRSTLINKTALDATDRATIAGRADSIEVELMQRAGTYGDYTRYLRTHWQDIRDRLDANDLAIEFIDYCRPDSTVMYGALLLAARWEAPVFVSLTDKAGYDLQAAAMDIGPATGDPIWKPLLPYLDGVEDIYFAPTGILHKLPIEYMPDAEGRSMAERYHIYRLSSTRILARTAPRERIRNAVLYGGLEYDATNVELSEADMNADRVIHLGHLTGTDREVNAIAPCLKADSIRVRLYEGEAGTEESFKALSDTDVNLIHLATHGLYMPLYDDELEAIPSLRLSARAKDEDRSLLNSAVCFAGVNFAHLASDLTTSNDGYLSAREVSAMDLHRADLVTLSACLTAEGEVTGEGVFGLQRGFKQAGANTLIMSAWKVDDQATGLLMTAFYRNLLAGRGKREALVAAQQELRATPGYDQPKFWAAFILLDGLE